jgi:hypothetical protein
MWGCTFCQTPVKEKGGVKGERPFLNGFFFVPTDKQKSVFGRRFSTTKSKPEE